MIVTEQDWIYAHCLVALGVMFLLRIWHTAEYWQEWKRAQELRAMHDEQWLG